jgi:hypothetical protein
MLRSPRVLSTGNPLVELSRRQEGGYAVLALTDTAVQPVKDIVSASEQTSETGGLRLAAEREGAQANLQLSIVSLPAEDDEVIEEQGPVSSSNPRRPPFSTTRSSTPASSTIRSRSRSPTSSRSNGRIHLSRRRGAPDLRELCVRGFKTSVPVSLGR